MKHLRVADYGEVLKCFARENEKSETNVGTDSFDWTKNRLAQAQQQHSGRCALVLLSRPDVLDITLPAHRHPAELIPDAGLSVAAAVSRAPRFQEQNPKCWRNIRFHEDRDFTQTHIFLEILNNRL
jgi:hypothetical protein